MTLNRQLHPALPVKACCADLPSHVTRLAPVKTSKHLAALNGRLQRSPPAAAFSYGALPSGSPENLHAACSQINAAMQPFINAWVGTCDTDPALHMHAPPQLQHVTGSCCI